jgi:hypothetical protein
MWILIALSAAFALPDLSTPLKTGNRTPADAAVVVGIEDYFVLPEVPHARSDAAIVRDLLVYTVGVPSDRVRVLDGQPAKEQIMQAVNDAAKLAGPDGTVWFYFAGHGAASPSSGERMLLGADVQADLAVFDARSLRVEDIRNAASSHGGKAVLWVDACYTGRGRSGVDLVPGKRFAVPTYATAAKPQVLEWTAAGAGEWSGPIDEVQHGAFTYLSVGALRGWADGQLTGTRDGVVTVEEAKLYVEEGLRTLQIVDQHPEMSGGGLTDALVRANHLENPPNLLPSKTPPVPSPSNADLPAPGVPIRLLGQGGGLCLDVQDRNPNNGANLQQWACVPDAAAQTFSLRRVDGGYAIVSALSGRCLDVQERNHDNGANLQIWDCLYSPYQTFRITNATGNQFNLANVGTGRCLDVADRRVDNGANIQQWDCSPGANQRFQWANPL